MDANLIYVKTAAGEEAVRQRTRVVQRNTRMVLILVDGNSSVAELCLKTGNEQLVEQALQELERDGLVAPKLEQDSVWEQSRKLAEEIKAAAMNRLSRELPKEEPIIAPQPMTANSVPAPFSVIPASIAPFSTFGGQAPQSLAPFSTFGGPPSVAPAVAPPPPPPPQEVRKAGGLFGRLFSRDTDDEVKPIQRGARQSKLSLTAAIVIGIVAFAVMLVLLFVFYPYDSHKAQIEATLGRILGQQVQIARVQAELAPKPGIILGGVRSKDVQVAQVRLLPEVFSLIGSRPVFSMVEIDGAQLSASALSALPKALSQALGSDPGMNARAVRFENMTVDVFGLPVNGLQAEVRSDDKGPLVLMTADRSFKAVLTSQDSGFSAQVEALTWQPAAESRFRFDSLQGLFEWNGQQLAVRSLDARIFDGAVLGSLLLTMQSGQPGLVGELAVKHMSLQRLVDGLGHGRQYEGELAGSFKLAGRAENWSALVPLLTGDGSFVINRAVLGGFDIVEAVRRGKAPVRGGATRFEQINGTLRILPEALRFSDLTMNSGLLRAVGNADLSHDMRWAGRLDVEMRGSATLVRMPLSVSGTLKDPVLQGAR